MRYARSCAMLCPYEIVACSGTLTLNRRGGVNLEGSMAGVWPFQSLARIAHRDAEFWGDVGKQIERSLEEA